ncbi:MAG: hypothetical protein QOJ99_4883 [Bryobacterales bacterium]|jgi:hypothetical protein|nr:hypothetical protein [Bryobacterales bacterium]
MPALVKSVSAGVLPARVVVHYSTRALSASPGTPVEFVIAMIQYVPTIS